VKILRTLAVSTALLGARLAIGAGGGAAVALATASGPTVPYQVSYPITVAAGHYELLCLLLDFAPGAGRPLHFHGGPAAVGAWTVNGSCEPAATSTRSNRAQWSTSTRERSIRCRIQGPPMPGFWLVCSCPKGLRLPRWLHRPRWVCPAPTSAIG
jgi:hypothetical protein